MSGRRGPTPRKRPPRVSVYDHAVTVDDSRRAVLTAVATPVTKFDGRLRRLCENMVYLAKHDPNCLGLAAPQINVGKRIIVIRDDRSVLLVVNPEIVSVGELTMREYEGCFSLPLKRVRVERHATVRIAGFDAHGAPVGPYTLSGRYAAAAQHEIDHLNGVLISDRGELEHLEPGARIATGVRDA